MPQGVSADLIATKYGISRDDVDQYAVESQKLAAKAWDAGHFKKSVVPVEDVNGLTILDKDEHMRPSTDMQSARRLLLQAKLLDTALRDAGRGGFKLRSPEARYSLELEWAKVSVDPDDYITQVFDTSVLPTLPSARAQEVERMQAAGWIEPDEARRLLDFPDLDQSNSLATADYDNLLWQFEQMLEHGRSVLPEPYQNLDRALRLGQASVLRAQRDGVPEDHIDKLRDFIAVVVEMLAPPEPPPAPPGAPPPGGTPTDRRDDVLTTAVPPDALPAPAAGP
jgi:hypothetical protein